MRVMVRATWRPCSAGRTPKTTDQGGRVLLGKQDVMLGWSFCAAVAQMSNVFPKQSRATRACREGTVSTVIIIVICCDFCINYMVGYSPTSRMGRRCKLVHIRKTP
jgi:hypothetical protein